MPAPTRIIPPPPHGTSWEKLMQEALCEAEKALQHNEVPVGAIVVTGQGNIIGRGYNQTISLHNPTAHAEIMAIQQAGNNLGNYRLQGCYLVVTLEPCLMCTGALVHARLAGLVYGANDPKSGTIDSCLDGLTMPFFNHHLWALGGILSSQCQAVLDTFFSQRRTTLSSAILSSDHE